MCDKTTLVHMLTHTSEMVGPMTGVHKVTFEIGQVSFTQQLYFPNTSIHDISN